MMVINLCGGQSVLVISIYIASGFAISFAIWLRPALWTHTKSTSVVMVLLEIEILSLGVSSISWFTLARDYSAEVGYAG